jgi:hypothetical protein
MGTVPGQRVVRDGRRLPRLLCRILGHDIRCPWPGTKALCLRCNQRWGGTG